MAEPLSPEWFELVVRSAAALPERPGATGHLRYVIGDGKRAEVTYDVVFVDGRLVTAGPDGDGEPDVVLNATKPVFQSIVSGEMDEQSALMRGKLKSSSTGPILRLLPVLQSTEWREVERAIAAGS